MTNMNTKAYFKTNHTYIQNAEFKPGNHKKSIFYSTDFQTINGQLNQKTGQSRGKTGQPNFQQLLGKKLSSKYAEGQELISGTNYSKK